MSNYLKNLDDFSSELQFCPSCKYFFQLDKKTKISTEVYLRDGPVVLDWLDIQNKNCLKNFYLPIRYKLLLPHINCLGYWGFQLSRRNISDSNEVLIFGDLNPVSFLSVKKRVELLKMARNWKDIRKIYFFLNFQQGTSYSKKSELVELLQDLFHIFRNHETIILTKEKFLYLNFSDISYYNLNPSGVLGLNTVEAFSINGGASELDIEEQGVDYKTFQGVDYKNYSLARSLFIEKGSQTSPCIPRQMDTEKLKIAKLLAGSLAAKEHEELASFTPVPLWYNKYLALLE